MTESTGPKISSLRDRHVVADVDEHRRLHEVARLESCRVAFASSENLGAFLDALSNLRLHAFVLFLGDHRPDGGIGIGGIANGKHRHRVPDAALDFVKTASRHKESCTRSAGLSAVQE